MGRIASARGAKRSATPQRWSQGRFAPGRVPFILHIHIPKGYMEKILCRFSIAIIRIFRYNRKDTRQVYAGGLWGVLRRLFVMI